MKEQERSEASGLSGLACADETPRRDGTLQRRLVALASMLVLASIAAPAQTGGTYRLDSVRVEGSQRYEVPEIVRASGLTIGQNTSLEALKKAAEDLGTLGIFARVTYRYETRGNNLTAVFTVQDAADLLPCSFANFVWFSTQELQQALQAHVPLYKGYVTAGGRMLDLVSAQLVAILETRGVHAQVQYSPQGGLGGPVKGMEFREVGVPLPVRKFEFPGVSKIDPSLLIEAARPLLGKDFDAPFIGNYSQRGLTAVYRQRGYLKAAFGEPVPHLMAGDPTTEGVAVTLPVSEGELYRLKEITWSGESAIPYSELAKLLHADVGAAVNSVQIEQDVLTMVLFFHPKGYLMADARPRAVLDNATHQAAYEIQIRQGDPFRLGKLEIAGLDDAHAASVMQHCRLRPGDPYDSTYWDRLPREISHLLPASPVPWIIRPTPTIHADTKTVDVRLAFLAGMHP